MSSFQDNTNPIEKETIVEDKEKEKICDKNETTTTIEVAENDESIAQLTLLLGQRLRILISDGRVVEGEFQCVDKDLNFILGTAVEYYGLNKSPTVPIISKKIIRRNLGLAMIPGKHVVQVFHGYESKNEEEEEEASNSPQHLKEEV